MRVTVAPVFRVAVIEAPSCTASETVATMSMTSPALYRPSALVVEKEVTAGATVSITMLLAPPMLLVPAGTLVFVIGLPAESDTLVIVNDETVRSAEFWPAATL